MKSLRKFFMIFCICLLFTGMQIIIALSRVFLRKMLGTQYGPVGTRFSLILRTRWQFSLILGTRIGSLKRLKKNSGLINMDLGLFIKLPMELRWFSLTCYTVMPIMNCILVLYILIYQKLLILLITKFYLINSIINLILQVFPSNCSEAICPIVSNLQNYKTYNVL